MKLRKDMRSGGDPPSPIVAQATLRGENGKLKFEGRFWMKKLSFSFVLSLLRVVVSDPRVDFLGMVTHNNLRVNPCYLLEMKEGHFDFLFKNAFSPFFSEKQYALIIRGSRMQ